MYQDLKLSDRARVIEMAVRSGITDLDTIEQVYNTFAQGGPKEELINRINSTSTANFVQRLKDPNREFINNPDGTISTHSMAYATMGNKAVVYPEVQEINGTLQRVPSDNALDSAISRRDTVMMSVPEAEWFTSNYKDYYPKGNTFDEGGDLEEESEKPKKKAKFDKPVSWYVSQKPELYQSISKISPEYLDKYFYIDDDGVIRSNLARDRFAHRREELKNSLGEIGYNQDNEIMLTTDGANARYRTGRISTDLLDYIYDNAARAKIPFKEAIGLAGKESTLGIGRGYKRGQSISPINLYSYWAGIGAGTRSNQQMKKLDQIYKQFYNGEQIDMEALAKAEAEYQKLYDNLHEFQGDNLVKAAYDYYKAGKYNPGEEGYDADVIRQGEAILSDKAVQKWLKSKKAYSGRGFSDGGSLEKALFKRNWELLWGNGRKFETGGPSDGYNANGMNPLRNLWGMLKNKYLTDYANSGRVTSYPYNMRSLVEDYILSPYNYKNGSEDTDRDRMLIDTYISGNAQRRALFSKYYGLEDTNFRPEDYLVESTYSPSSSTNPDAKYYTYKIDDAYDRSSSFFENNGKFKIDEGEDEKGKYVSLYDIWDLAPFKSRVGNQMGGTPVEMYDRFYESENPRVYYRLKGMVPERKKELGGNLLEDGGPEGDPTSYFGEIKQGKPFNAWDRYLANHPMVGHRLRKAKTLIEDAARVHPYTSLLMDFYDIRHGFNNDWDKYSTSGGIAGKVPDIIYNVVNQAGEINPSIKDVFLKKTLFGKVLSIPDMVNDSYQFIEDFSTPVTEFKDGGSKEGLKKRNGGRLFGDGGPGKITVPNPETIRNSVRGMIPTSVLRAISHYGTRTYDKDNLQYINLNYDGSIHDMLKDLGKEDDWDAGETFLYDPVRQKLALEKKGYHYIDDGDYGLVSSAVDCLSNVLGGKKIPIYQIGEDEISRDKLTPIPGSQDELQYLGYRDEVLKHAGSYPTALYLDKDTGDYYIRSWDLNDYGQHDGKKHDSGNHHKAAEYGAKQILADIYDHIGNPFVQRSGLKKIPKEWVSGLKSIPIIPEIEPDSFYLGELEPSVVTANKKSSGGNLFETGGPEGKKQNWFTRATLGAMMADSPAVAQASGWTYGDNGDIVQTEQDSEGAKQLRAALAEIASMALTDLVVDVAGAAIVGTKTYKSIKLARELNKMLKAGEFDAAVDMARKASAEAPKNVFHSTVYKGGEIRDPYYSSFTTDPEYAANYGDVKRYTFEGNPAVTQEPIMGSHDPVTTDMFIERATGGDPSKTAILGRDKVTSEFNPSKGVEIVSLSPKNNLVELPEPSTLSLTPDDIRYSNYDFNLGNGYSGYTPTLPSKRGIEFVDDVNEAVKMAESKGGTGYVNRDTFTYPTDKDGVLIKGDEYIGSGAESHVFQHPTDADKVIKYERTYGYPSKEEAIERAVEDANARNKRLYNITTNVEGAAFDESQQLWYPVTSQQRLTELPSPGDVSLKEAESVMENVDRFARRIGTGTVYGHPDSFARTNNVFLENLGPFDYHPNEGWFEINPSEYKDFGPKNIGFTDDGFLMGYDLRKYGGKIRIKPENRGKFTALKKRTGHSASWFKAHGTPAQKKMAVFALNSRKWKHGDGGHLMTKL